MATVRLSAHEMRRYRHVDSRESVVRELTERGFREGTRLLSTDGRQRVGVLRIPASVVRSSRQNRVRQPEAEWFELGPGILLEAKGSLPLALSCATEESAQRGERLVKERFGSRFRVASWLRDNQTGFLHGRLGRELPESHRTPYPGQLPSFEDYQEQARALHREQIEALRLDLARVAARVEALGTTADAGWALLPDPPVQSASPETQHNNLRVDSVLDSPHRPGGQSDSEDEDEDDGDPEVEEDELDGFDDAGGSSASSTTDARDGAKTRSAVGSASSASAHVRRPAR